MRWEEFGAFFTEMRDLGIVESMKDFYWDVRPKPEFGTIEIRACDSPLDIALAVEITAYAQSIAEELMGFFPNSTWITRMERAFSYNKFQASRFGMSARFIAPDQEGDLLLGDYLIATLDRRMKLDPDPDRRKLLKRLLSRLKNEPSGADWLREGYRQTNSLEDTMRLSSERWAHATNEISAFPS